MILLSLCMMGLSPILAQEPSLEVFAEKEIVFFEKVPALLQEEKWSEVVFLGEKALREETLSSQEMFAILDQLVSSYFRLGCFEKAKETVNELVSLGQTFNQPYFVVDSLYKLSAVLRGRADMEKDAEKQKKLFAESYNVIEHFFFSRRARSSYDSEGTWLYRT